MNKYEAIRQMMVNQLYWYDYITVDEDDDAIDDVELVNRYESMMEWRYSYWNMPREEFKLVEEFKELVAERLITDG